MADRSTRVSDLFVRFLRRSKPLRTMPIPLRYLLTAGIVFVCFAIRYALDDYYPYPYLVFLFGIIFAALVFDRGSGFIATFLSAALALYFFIEPRASFEWEHIGAALSVVLFVAVGFLAASIIEALRQAVEELAIANESLRESRHELRDNLNVLEAVIEGTTDPIAVKNREGRFVRVNSGYARLLNASPDMLMGKKIGDFLPNVQAERLERAEREVMETRESFIAEALVGVPGKGHRWFVVTKVPWYGPDGTLAGIIIVGRDIHDRKMAEEVVQAANAQKELLLYDINHRIKNHLQSITGTLVVHRRQLTGDPAQNAIGSTISRLQVLSRVYDRLQLKADGESVVSSADFIDGLCSDLRSTLVDPRPVTLWVQADDIPLHLSRAVPVGLIINEALTNTLKHAFPEGTDGNITIDLKRNGEVLCLTISDDGIGAPGDRIGGGTGTKLIHALVQQLGGTVEWGGGPGTSLRVEFPLAAAAKA